MKMMSIFNDELKSSIHQGTDLPALVKPVSQKDINMYAEASGDFNPIHVDEAFAAQTPLGGTIAHGMLVLAYISEMMTKAFGHNWYSAGKLSVRFKTPARPKDTITVSGKVDSIKVKEDASYAVCNVEARNQGGEAVITGEAVVKL
jgi:3-hydroxybutyryl-CoA dehydratase